MLIWMNMYILKSIVTSIIIDCPIIKVVITIMMYNILRQLLLFWYLVQDGKTPLDMAESEGYAKVAQFLRSLCE